MDGADIDRWSAEHIVTGHVEVELLQRSDGTRCFVDGVDTFLRHRAVSGYAFRFRLSQERPLVTDERPVAGRLRHDESSDPAEPLPAATSASAPEQPVSSLAVITNNTPGVAASRSASARQAVTRPRRQLSCPSCHARKASHPRSRRRMDRPTRAAHQAALCRDVPKSERQAIRLAADTRDQLRPPFAEGNELGAKPAPANNPANRSAQARSAPGGLTVLKRTSSCVSSIEGCIVYPK